MRILPLLLALFLGACDSEVGRTFYAEDVEIVTTYQQCSKGPGTCCTTGYTAGGKYKTGCGYYRSCPGRQLVLVEQIPYTIHYESGDTSSHVATKVIKELGECE